MTLSIDGTSISRGASVGTLIATVTTTLVNDVLFAFVSTATQAATITSMSSSPVLVWTRRSGTYIAATNAELWYAPWSSSGPCTITAVVAVSTTAGIAAWGVAGGVPSAPFDPNGAASAVGTGNSTLLSATITTTNATDMIIGAFGSRGSPTWTAASGYSTITGTTTGPTIGSEYQNVSSVQSGLVVSSTLSGANNYVFIADALQANEFTVGTGAFHSSVAVIGVSPPGLGIDGSWQKHVTSSTLLVTTISTAFANDVLIVYLMWNGVYTDVTPAIGDTAGLVWNHRVYETNAAATDTIDEWWAVAPSILTNDVITFTSNNANKNLSMVMVAVTGAETASPFDSNASLPGLFSGASSTIAAATISTTVSKSLILGAMASDNSAGQTWTAAGSFALLQTANVNAAPQFATSFWIASSPQTKLNVEINTGIAASSAFIADALVPLNVKGAGLFQATAVAGAKHQAVFGAGTEHSSAVTVASEKGVGVGLFHDSVSSFRMTYGKGKVHSSVGAVASGNAVGSGGMGAWVSTILSTLGIVCVNGLPVYYGNPPQWVVAVNAITNAKRERAVNVVSGQFSTSITLYSYTGVSQPQIAEGLTETNGKTKTGPEMAPGIYYFNWVPGASQAEYEHTP